VRGAAAVRQQAAAATTPEIAFWLTLTVAYVIGCRAAFSPELRKVETTSTESTVTEDLTEEESTVDGLARNIRRITVPQSE
jgi:hypothetical protein